jgi:DNA repair exonuclease SbcCD nuclease subunit
MRLLILHLSDLHIKSAKDTIFQKQSKIVDAILPTCADISGIIIIVSGDLAFSGRPEEYSAVKILLSQIKESLSEKTEKTVTLITVPGNHDCAFQQDDIRDLVLGQLKSPVAIKPQYVKQCLSVQGNFFSFYGEIRGREISNQLQWIEEEIFEEKKIAIHCFNSAWMSQMHEIPGSLCFPISDIKPVTADLVISVFHHPYAWFSTETAPLFRQLIESTSDIVITGHEHLPDSYSKQRAGSNNQYFEGGVLNESNNPNKSEFAIIVVDFKAKSQKQFRFSWKGQEYIPADGYTPKDLPFNRNAHLLRNAFQLNESFVQKVNDLGATFSHPAKDTIYLDEVFIMPTLKILAKDIEKKGDDRRVRPDNFEQFLFEKSKLVILGDQDSGKTCLAKRTFSFLREKEFVPLIIDGNKITSSQVHRDDFLKLAEKIFNQTYFETEWNRYLQLPMERKVIIIDNFDKVALNPTGKTKFLSILNETFGKLIFFADNVFKVEELTLLGYSDNPFIEFDQLEILPFGYKQRLELIERWIILGREYVYPYSELQRNLDQINKIINSIMGRELIPSYPIYILALLQQVETNRHHATASGSYGHLFDFLITDSLVKRGSSTIDLGILKNYLASLSFSLFKQCKLTISDTEFEAFHAGHCQLYALSIEFKEIKKHFLDCYVIENVHGNYGFKYKYYYTYFVGRYLADHLEKDQVKSAITEMCEKLYREDYANIVIFLSYFSQSEFLFSKIIETCDGLFEKVNPCDFDKDIQFANQLAGGRNHKFSLENKTTKENRAAVAESTDRFEETLNSDDESKVETLSEVNKAFKTIQVTGQLLRSYQGSLEGNQKLVLTQRGNQLGLRTLNYILGIFKDNYAELVKGLQAHLTQKDSKLDEIKAEDRAKYYLFWICQFLGLGITKRVAQAIGNRYLKLTFEELVGNDPTIGNKLIYLCIKLDHFDAFPISEIESLNHQLQGNIFALGVLKIIVLNHLSLFDIDFRLKQRVCTTLGISIAQVQLFELKNSAEKN